MLCFIFCNVGLVLIGFIVNKFVRKMSFTELCHMLAQVFPTAIFFVMTYAIYTPSSLFLQNISEFSITYSSKSAFSDFYHFHDHTFYCVVCGKR